MTELVSQVIRRARKTYKCDAWETLYEMADYHGEKVAKCRGIKAGDCYEDQTVSAAGEGVQHVRSCRNCIVQLSELGEKYDTTQI